MRADSGRHGSRKAQPRLRSCDESGSVHRDWATHGVHCTVCGKAIDIEHDMFCCLPGEEGERLNVGPLLFAVEPARQEEYHCWGCFRRRFGKPAIPAPQGVA